MKYFAEGPIPADAILMAAHEANAAAKLPASTFRYLG
jgi:hypothetical protein